MTYDTIYIPTNKGHIVKESRGGIGLLSREVRRSVNVVHEGTISGFQILRFDMTISSASKSDIDSGRSSLDELPLFGTSEEEAADECLWQEKFAASKDLLLSMAAKARVERREGKTFPLETIIDR